MKRAIGWIIFSLLSGYTFAQHRVATDILLKTFEAKELPIGHTLQRGFYLLKLDRNFKAADLVKNSIDIVRYLPDNFAIVKNGSPRDGRTLRSIQRVYVPNNNWKLSDPLLTQSKPGEGKFVVQTTDVSRLMKFLFSKGIHFTQTSSDVIALISGDDFVRTELLSREEVIYIGSESTTPAAESRILELNLSPNHINEIHNFHPEINGSGTTISIKELAFDPADVDLKGRAISTLTPEDEPDNHATDIATIAAGAGNSFITGKGPAWKSNIISSDYSQLMPDPNAQFIAADAWVQNHSYGTTIENFYGVFARAYDQSANSLPQLLHVFSSGNEGTSGATSGQYQGLQGAANLTGNFKMSKNTLSIGAVDTTRNPLAFSSRGPAYDGRVKPELAAFSVQGTSNAAALVSGSVALLQQAYKEKFGTFPPSALVKAFLINSAEDAGAPGLDYVTGFGNVDAYHALQLLQDGKFITGSISQNEIKSYDLVVPPGATNLKVSIVWNDPAANANSAKALVNDIDLSLITNNGTYFPWILNTASAPSVFTQQATRGRDGLNNVEQITVDEIAGGTYTLEVKGFDIPQGPQEFFITYDWEIENSFEWQFPTRSDNFPYNGETGTYFYWNSTREETNGTLEYSINGGSGWSLIASTVNLEKGYHRWSNPPSINSAAIARMTVGGQIYTTEEFTISYPAKMSVGFNCTDSLMLKWQSISEAVSYQIYALGEKFMEPLLMTPDTSVVIKKEESSALYYAIEPILSGGRRAIRSAAVNYTSFGVGCYLISFFPELVQADGIYLNTFLGTTYGVTSVIFEREMPGGFEEIGRLNADDDYVRFLDPTPVHGWNRYRAKILFANGEELISDVVQEFFLSTKPFAVFPNPVSANGELRIYSKIFSEMSYDFRLFKSDGSMVTEMELNTDREVIPLDGIPAGLYIYHLTSEEGRFIGKLIIH
jgi:hypothetical protein